MRYKLPVSAYPSFRNLSSLGGQATVEFALTIPILILLLFGFMGLAIVFFGYLTCYSAAREGSTYVAGNPLNITDQQVKDQICATSASGLGGSLSACQTNYQPGGSLVITVSPSCTTVPCTCTGTGCTNGRVPGLPMTVIVSYLVPLPTLSVPIGSSSFTFLAPIQVSATSVTYIEQ